MRGKAFALSFLAFFTVVAISPIYPHFSFRLQRYEVSVEYCRAVGVFLFLPHAFLWRLGICHGLVADAL